VRSPIFEMLTRDHQIPKASKPHAYRNTTANPL
jgi:hypothetical protein